MFRPGLAVQNAVRSAEPKIPQDRICLMDLFWSESAWFSFSLICVSKGPGGTSFLSEDLNKVSSSRDLQRGCRIWAQNTEVTHGIIHTFQVPLNLVFSAHPLTFPEIGEPRSWCSLSALSHLSSYLGTYDGEGQGSHAVRQEADL